MEPRITIVTLGVDDLERSLTFYREGLGLPSQGIVGQEFEHGSVAFFELRGGVRLALFPRESIARGPRTLWRYRALLPIDGERLVDTHAGYTPLIRAENLGRALGLRNPVLRLTTGALESPSS